MGVFYVGEFSSLFFQNWSLSSYSRWRIFTSADENRRFCNKENIFVVRLEFVLAMFPFNRVNKSSLRGIEGSPAAKIDIENFLRPTSQRDDFQAARGAVLVEEFEFLVEQDE